LEFDLQVNADSNSIDPEIAWCDDACPICHSPICTRGTYLGVWDGSMGDGCGNVRSATCLSCGSHLIGFEYEEADKLDQPGVGSESKIRWEARRPGA
jgi:hypothetical protein